MANAKDEWFKIQKNKPKKTFIDILKYFQYNI